MEVVLMHSKLIRFLLSPQTC
uniref:Uncharacterized protein n=1 Tax=Rhizophora mucronata TaxID=61149 RepID=A0A2P2QIF9_RHIMU